MEAPVPKQPLRIALLGNPNCGKTALFNLLTGSRQKVANYAGVTVERKEGVFRTTAGRQVSVLDLPGAYSLNALSGDEAVTRDVITGHSQEVLPDLLVCVVDATNLRLHLRLVLEARRLGLPLVVALNKMDRARQLGIHIDTSRLARELNLYVTETVSVHTHGADTLRELLDENLPSTGPSTWRESGIEQVIATQHDVLRIFQSVVTEPAIDKDPSDRMDRFLMHPVWGFAVLAVVLFLTFMAVFSGGAVLSGIIIGNEHLRLGRRYGLSLIIESGLLLLSYYLFVRNIREGELFASAACGLQNAMVATYSGNAIRTTHMTGVVSDLGSLVGNFIARRRVDPRQFLLLSIVFVHFYVGGMLGTYLFRAFAFGAILVPATLTMVTGIAYFIYRVHKHVRTQEVYRTYLSPRPRPQRVETGD